MNMLQTLCITLLATQYDLLVFPYIIYILWQMLRKRMHFAWLWVCYDWRHGRNLVIAGALLWRQFIGCNNGDATRRNDILWQFCDNILHETPWCYTNALQQGSKLPLIRLMDLLARPWRLYSKEAQWTPRRRKTKRKSTKNENGTQNTINKCLHWMFFFSFIFMMAVREHNLHKQTVSKTEQAVQ